MSFLWKLHLLFLEPQLQLVDVLCRERLCLLCPDRSIDMNSPPNLPAIWTDWPRSVSAVLKLNVDAVIAQVNMI
jgi:hypothetical protein